MKTKLTKLERFFLDHLKEHNDPDEYNCGENGCTFTLESYCDWHGLTTERFRGVLSSLLKKDIIIDPMEKCPSSGKNLYEYNWK